MNRKQLIIFLGFFGILFLTTILLAIVGNLRFVGKEESAAQTTVAQTTQTQGSADSNSGEYVPFATEVARSTAQTNAPAGQNSVGVLDIIIRLSLAVILSSILAFRPRRNIPLFQRNLYVAQTQILLAVVAAALMLIVGDNAARAFAIFAAVSLVRFRTNIRDPKEVTVLLISLALGLAAGVGQWSLGIAVCLFSLVLLWVLEQNESEKVFRSMALTVRTRNTDSTQALLKRMFEAQKLDAEVRQIDPPDEANPIGCIMYYLNLRLNLSTDYLSDRIMSSDGKNIEGIQWEQKKESSYIYQ